MTSRISAFTTLCPVGFFARLSCALSSSPVLPLAVPVFLVNICRVKGATAPTGVG